MIFQSIKEGRLEQDHDYPLDTQNLTMPAINSKTISYENLLNIIGRRFHTCLFEESKLKPDLADKLTDAELVH